MSGVRVHGMVRTSLDYGVVEEWVRIVAVARLAEGFDGEYAAWLAAVAQGSTFLAPF